MNNNNILKIFPSFITILSLILGITAIKLSINNSIELAIKLILIASICDLLDGRIARLLKATSEFGGELDSLCDFATFCIAPALILYYGYLHQNVITPKWQHSSLEWISICFFVTSGLLRLARFNVLVDTENKSYSNFFMGVPVPAAALLLFFPFYIKQIYGVSISNYVVITFIIIISLLMVSPIPTFSTKKLYINKKYTPIVLSLLSLFVLLLFYYTFYTLIICGILYLISIPITASIFFIIKLKKNIK